jgi:hypothetical protein
MVNALITASMATHCGSWTVCSAAVYIFQGHDIYHAFTVRRIPAQYLRFSRAVLRSILRKRWECVMINRIATSVPDVCCMALCC